MGTYLAWEWLVLKRLEAGISPRKKNAYTEDTKDKEKRMNVITLKR